MRLGILADVHGNDVALRAVLDDAAECRVDRWWILGDLVLFGPRPAEVLTAQGSTLASPTISLVSSSRDAAPMWWSAVTLIAPWTAVSARSGRSTRGAPGYPSLPARRAGLSSTSVTARRALAIPRPPPPASGPSTERYLLTLTPWSATSRPDSTPTRSSWRPCSPASAGSIATAVSRRRAPGAAD